MEKLIAWVEIPATDMERAVTFYNTVFQLDLKIANFGEEKMACFPNGEGAISQSPDFKPSRDGALVSFNASQDLQETIDRIKSLGCDILKGKTKIEADGFGYFAMFVDSEGNKVGLYGKK